MLCDLATAECDQNELLSAVQDGPKTGPFLKVYNPVYDDVGRCSLHQNVQLSVTSKTGILNVAILKYSLKSSQNPY